jgi:C4-dicarboxylate-binding protein DctP
MKKINIMLGMLLLSISAMSLAEPVVIKFSHVVAPDTPKGKAAEKFKQMVEERSKGAMKVEIYPNSQLYKDREELEALQLGAVQMLAPSMAKFGPLGAREFELFDLPFMFPNKETLYRTMDGVVGSACSTSWRPVACLLGQRLQADERQQGYTRWPISTAEDAHTVLQSADAQ